MQICVVCRGSSRNFIWVGQSKAKQILGRPTGVVYVGIMGMTRTVCLGQSRVWVGHGLPGLIARIVTAQRGRWWMPRCHWVTNIMASRSQHIKYFCPGVILPHSVPPVPLIKILPVCLLRFCVFLNLWVGIGNPTRGRGTPFPPLLLPCPFTSSSFALFYFIPFSFSHSLYQFSSIVHPFPFYQNRPTPFPGRRS